MKESLGEILGKCKENYLSSEQEFLFNLDDDIFESTEQDRHLIARSLFDLSTVRKSGRISPPNPSFFGELLRSLGVDGPGVFELVGDSGAGKSLLAHRAFTQAGAKLPVYFFSNTLVSDKPPNGSFVFLTLSFKKLATQLCLLTEELASSSTSALIFIDDLSVIAYEMDKLPVYVSSLGSFCKIVRVLIDFCGCTIVSTSLPKKSGKEFGLKLGGLLPSPWRLLPRKSLYLDHAQNSINVTVVDNHALVPHKIVQVPIE